MAWRVAGRDLGAIGLVEKGQTIDVSVAESDARIVVASHAFEALKLVEEQLRGDFQDGPEHRLQQCPDRLNRSIH
jgi:hypothetical protein